MSRDQIPGRDAIIWIYDEWLKSNPRKGAIAVEVGVALGKSISYLADRLIELGRDDVTVYAVDPWAGYAQNGEQQQLAKDAGGDFCLYARQMLDHDPKAFERIRVIRAGSTAAACFFESWGLDLVVIDADHSYESVLAGLRAWLGRMRTDGWIGGDDHHAGEFPGVVRACTEIFGDPGVGYEVSMDNPYRWPLWLRRGVR